MKELPVRKSHTTAWIVSIVAAPVVYGFGFPWFFWGWAEFVGKAPGWLEALSKPWEWMDNSGLRSYVWPYWSWCAVVCTHLKNWVDTFMTH